MIRPASVVLVFSLVFTRALHGQPLSEGADRASVQQEGMRSDFTTPAILEAYDAVRAAAGPGVFLATSLEHGKDGLNDPNLRRLPVEPAERSLTRMEAPMSSLPALDLQRSIRRAAFRQSQHTNHRMPKGFLWTGVGLLSYGGFLFALGAGYGPDNLDCPGGDCRLCATAGCPKTQQTLFRGAMRFVASGAAVLGIGAVIGARRSPDLAPRITVNGRGVAVQQPVPVHLWWRHASPWRSN